MGMAVAQSNRRIGTPSSTPPNLPRGRVVRIRAGRDLVLLPWDGRVGYVSAVQGDVYSVRIAGDAGGQVLTCGRGALEEAGWP